MSKARPIRSPYRDWVLEQEESELRKDPWWAEKLNRMGAQMEFNAPEAAGIIGYRTTDPIYALVDSGEYDGTNIGTGSRRRVTISRKMLKALLAERRTGAPR